MCVKGENLAAKPIFYSSAGSIWGWTNHYGRGRFCCPCLLVPGLHFCDAGYPDEDEGDG